MTVSISIKKGRKPTQEQIQEVREAAKREQVFDEVCPEYSYEQLKRYREAALNRHGEKPVTLNLSEGTIQRAKEYGTDYRRVLSRLIDVALGDPDMMKKVIN